MKKRITEERIEGMIKSYYSNLRIDLLREKLDMLFDYLNLEIKSREKFIQKKRVKKRIPKNENK